MFFHSNILFRYFRALLVRKKMSETDKIEGIGDILIEQVSYLWNVLNDSREFYNFKIFGSSAMSLRSCPSRT